MVAALVNGTRVIGLDLGGTKILGGILDEHGRVLERHEVHTPTDSQEALLVAIEAVVDQLFSEEIAAVAVGVPSRIDSRTGRVMGSVNIPLADVDLRDRLRARFRRPTGVGNDANVATLGEWRAGAGRGTRDMVMLTLGTGAGHGHLEAVASGTAADRAAQELWGADAGAEELVERAKAGEANARDALA